MNVAVKIFMTKTIKTTTVLETNVSLATGLIRTGLTLSMVLPC